LVFSLVIISLHAFTFHVLISRLLFLFLSIWGFSWISCAYFYITLISTS
jgi:hypothetical protein